jgi:hypothetical protein
MPTLRPVAVTVAFCCTVALMACGSSPPSAPATPSVGGSGGAGGRSSRGGGGSGGNAEPVPPGSAGGTGGAAGTGQGGSGGAPTAADAGTGEGGGPVPPASAAEKPLPPCKRTVAVASTGELGTAITGAQPGDCIVMADGSYTFPTITKTATEEAPIVIRAANRGKAVVASGVIHLLSSEHVVVEGLDVTSNGAASTFLNGGSNGMLIAFTDSRHCRLTRCRIHPSGGVVERDWIVISGAEAHHNRVDHNDLGPVNALANMLVVEGTGREEPLTIGKVSQYNRIDHNHFHDVNNTGGNNWESMRIGRSWQGPTEGFNVIEYNLLTRATGDPETISLKSSANIVRYNTLRATSGEITIRHGNKNQVYGNYMLADGNGSARGMRILGADHRIFNNYIENITSTAGIFLRGGSDPAEDESGAEFYRVYRTHIVNNTLVGGRGITIGSDGLPPLNCVVANNIVQNTTGAAITDTGEGTKIEGNILFPMGGGTPGVAAGNRVIDPMLTKVNAVFRPAPGSPVIDSALDGYPYVMEDIDGHPRVKPDVGADELSDAPMTHPGPLTAPDVGPNAP